ncbi:hypothetical protein [Burkholderia ambifaria]|uniref:hypothetical protein n=1 Tax=Burkholderia ambifaria TaxID=152480 RepID=UPI00158A558D|nr:hypothetical protein [Burkholderia ambifaria]
MKWDPNSFTAYDPCATFSSSSDRRFVKSTGESSFEGWDALPELEEDALWNLGKSAFDALGISSLDEFNSRYQAYLDAMQANREMLSELHASGKLLARSRGGDDVSPDWSKYSPDEILGLIWKIFGQLDEVNHNKEFEELLRFAFLFSCLKMIENAIIASMLAGDGLIYSILSAANAFSNAQALAVDGQHLKKARREIAYRAAIERHRKDPKQLAKAKVKELWEMWRNDSSRYPSKAAFARDMINKFDELKSSKKIEDWVRAWESGAL